MSPADVVVAGAGDIGLVRIPGAGGFLIRVGQWLNGDGFADYEHAFVMVQGASLVEGTTRLLQGGVLVEAEPQGARLADFTRSYGGGNVVWLRCPDEHRESVAEAARALVGTPYGFADYLALALRRIHLPVPGLRAYIRSTRSLICSQLCVQAAREGGWMLLGAEFDGYVTPGALRRLAEQQKGASA